jgi:hypothetical protein
MPEILLAPSVVNARAMQLFTLEGAWGACDIVCPVCRSLLHAFDDGEGAFTFCAHTIALLCDGEGPKLWRGRASQGRGSIFDGEGDSLHQDLGSGEEDGDFAAVPLVGGFWMRVEIHYQGDCYNWSWTLSVAWPVERLQSEDPQGSINASLAELGASLEARFGGGY